MVNITLTGGNTDDYRVTMCDLALTPLAASYKYGERARSSLILAAENATGNVYSLSYRIVKGRGTLLLDGFVLTEGEHTPYLVGGDPARSSSLTFNPAGEGEVRIDVTSTDIYGQQLTKSLRTVYEEENPIKIKFSGPATVPGNKRTLFGMELSEVDYTGQFFVLFESLEAPSDVNFYFETFLIPESVMFNNLYNGEFSIKIEPYNYSGPAHLRVTVRDDKGNESTADLKLTVTP